MVKDQTSRFADEVEYTKEDNPQFQGRFIHTFQFKAAPSNNFIRIEELPYGLHDMEVLGFGQTFGRSNGLVGAWDLWDKEKRFRSRDGRVYGGFDATKVAQDWRVQESESFLAGPSDICVSETTCGDGLEVQCIEDLYSFDRSTRNFCDASCEDIAEPILRLFCLLDTERTGLNFWACKNSSRNTIINESIPRACPGGCRVDSTNQKFYIEEIDKKRDCLWAIEEPKRVKFRCNLPEVALNCCQSCCSACVGDAAGEGSFSVLELGIEATCEWAASEDPATRCSYESVIKNCCETCASAVPSDNPSTLPSTIPSFLPTLSPSLISDAPSSIPSIFPSSMPSQHPTDFPTATPTSPPSETPSRIFSASPSSKPSQVPSDLPSKAPTDLPTQSPTKRPTKNPTKSPTSAPSENPSSTPSESPSALPSSFPSSYPTEVPSSIPSLIPSMQPTSQPSANPTSIPSVIPSNLPSREPSVKPTRSPELVPSPSAFPSANPSTSPSSTTIPSTTPSLSPSSAPSTMPPTQDPSEKPSVVPSTAPSLSPVPTQSATCNNAGFIDSSIKFVYLNLCWVAELKEGGVLAADFTDNDCSNPEFTKTAVFSNYNVNATNFVPGTLGWSGTFVFREDSSASTGNTNATVGPSSIWNVDELTFVIHWQVQSCEI